MKRTALAAIALAVAAAAALSPAPALGDAIRDRQWHLPYLNASSAQEASKGAGVTVAIVDTGVDMHPDLQGNLLPGTNTTAGATGDGRQDRDGHGTGMAGLVAAKGHGPKAGALGIAPEAKILPIAVDLKNKNAGNESVAAGIEWATENGADVINISGGGAPSVALQKAVARAIDADIVVVASAGNRPGDRGIQFPAFYPGVVAVGASDRSGNVAEVSVRGKGLVLVAPGVDIMTTRPGGRYAPGTGTSDAAAIVSGAVALVRSKYPDLSAEEVVHRLTATATDKGAPGLDEEYGYGVLNLVEALTADVPPLSASAQPPTAGGATSQPGRAGGPTQDDNLVLPIALVALLALGGVFALFVLRSRRSR